MTKTVLINRPISESEIAEISRLEEQGAQIFTFSGGNQKNATRKICLSADEKRAINYSVMEEVLNFGDLKVGDQTIAELFRIDTASVWHYHKFRVYFSVRNLMYFLNPVSKTFESFDDQVWFVSAEMSPLKRLFPEVDFRFPQVKTKEKINFWELLGYSVIVFYRFSRQLLSRKKQPEYLIYLTEKYSTVLDPKSLKARQGHHILEYLIDKLDTRFALLTEVLMPRIKGKSDYSYSPKQFRSEYNNIPKIFAESFWVTGLLKSRVRKEVNRARRQLKRRYILVRNTDLSIIQKITLEVFRSLDKSSVFFLYRYYAACDFFAKSKIKAIIASDENSPLTKSILDAAKHHGIKVIGLQHGTMHDLHPAYLFTPNDSKNRIMPDLTLTWGKYWEEFLVSKGNYPKDSVVSVGQIRTDIISALMKVEKQRKARPIDKVVFASQPQRDPELRRQAAWDVFTAVKNVPKVRLIVKLHPREAADSDYYSEIARQAGCTNYEIDTSSDLYQLISSCDVLITCFSTVGTETVYFYKPLVILDHLRQDIQGYAAEGVAFQATDSESLSLILSGIFRGTLKINQEKYDAFIRKYAYRIDGKVAERCIEAITKI